jgi:ribosomal protein S18 acetylase RimI-like enzyme
VVGLCDASVVSDLATIDTIVVHPDHRRTGLATALLDTLIERLRGRGATTLDAWTRDDADTLAWYASQGFDTRFRYLHVYANTAQEMEAAGAAPGELVPRAGFFHADVAGSGDQALESQLRTNFERVHACQRMVRDIS